MSQFTWEPERRYVYDDDYDKPGKVRKTGVSVLLTLYCEYNRFLYLCTVQALCVPLSLMLRFLAVITVPSR